MKSYFPPGIVRAGIIALLVWISGYVPRGDDGAVSRLALILIAGFALLAVSAWDRSITRFNEKHREEWVKSVSAQLRAAHKEEWK